ncbi:MAG: glycosyltransferase family 4 protein [Candidatus Thorarchaeota archaeon]|nr:glycosyltransferase family 4 protein [Candidatus Thorarchaeota archaeon]
MVSKFHAADGLCIRANDVLKGLLDGGHEVHAFTQSKKVDGLPSKRVHRFSAVQLNPHFSIDSISSVRMIARESRRHKIDVLHVQMNSGSTEFVLPFFKKSLPPLALTYHLAYAQGSSMYTTIFGIAWKASLYAARKYDEVILVDPSQKPHFVGNGIPEEKISVIKNGIETDVFIPPKKAKDDGIVDFVFVGRLSYDKGAHLLLKAFGEYHRINPQSRLTLIGDGMVKPQINGTVDDDSIRWIGTIPHEKIPEVLGKMDVFVIPQNIGGLGLSVMEAMSCELPVITTAIGETIRLLTDEEGVLVKPDSMKAVLEGMKFLGDSPDLRKSMGRKCREKIVKSYSWKTQIESLEKSYERAIAHSKNTQH